MILLLFFLYPKINFNIKINKNIIIIKYILYKLKMEQNIFNLNNKTIKKLLNSSFKILDYNKLRFKPIF